MFFFSAHPALFHALEQISVPVPVVSVAMLLAIALAFRVARIRFA